MAEDRWLYAFEADAAGEAIRAGRQEFAPPGMTWDDTLGNLRVLDKWRADVGLIYGIERAGGAAAHGAQHAARRARAAIPRRAIPGSAKPASVLALGFEDFPDFASASILLDAFFERGGNVFDTAWVYGGGRTEAVLGEWLRARGVRDEVGGDRQGRALAADLSRRDRQAARPRASSGSAPTMSTSTSCTATTPTCRSASSSTPWTPRCAAGRIRGPFGGSNWTRERFDAAIAYAEAHRQGRRRRCSPTTSRSPR